MLLLFGAHYFYLAGLQDRLPRIKERACAITRAQCCLDCCVVNELGYKKGYNMILNCMMAREEMSREENKNDLRATIQVGGGLEV